MENVEGNPADDWHEPLILPAKQKVSNNKFMHKVKNSIPSDKDDKHEWKSDSYAPLWMDVREPFFENLNIKHIRQKGPTCVPTSLAIIANSFSEIEILPEHFMQEILNTQYPPSWSDALIPFGIQLAYCNSDARNLRNYIDELVEYNDLFMIGYYSTDRYSDVPNSKAKRGESTGSSHMVTLYQDTIYDSAIDSDKGGVISLSEYSRLDVMIKRIFRVIPITSERRI